MRAAPSGGTSLDDGADVLLEATRGGAIESVHRGHVAVVDAGGTLHAAAGRPEVLCYPRSAVKPLQAAAVATIVEQAQPEVDARAWAIAASSHDGSTHHQVEVARLLAVAGFDETALRCPPDWPADRRTAVGTTAPSRLAHNCSGKHAAFLLAQRVLEQPPECYLAADGPLQERVHKTLEACAGVRIGHPAVDGCGAPAWRLPLDRLAFMFALAARDGASGVRGHPGEVHLAALRGIASSMRAHPELIGGEALDDTAFMRADERVTAKRGAEGVFAAATAAGIGIAVKINDGGNRAVAPIVAALLAGLGARVPPDLSPSRARETAEGRHELRLSPRMRAMAQVLTSGTFSHVGNFC